MAVETRYVVIRTDKSNKEQEVMTFTDKRAADDYDKMLDMADGMYDLLQNSQLTGELNISEDQCEALSIYIAKQREEVLIALQAKKKPAVKSKTKSSKNANDESQADLALTESDQPKKTLSESASDTHSSEQEDNEDNLIDFVIEKDDAA